MTPTNELRFVERQVTITENVSQTIIILQQKLAGEVSTGPLKIDVEHREEWRDVPVEKEPKP